MLLYTVLGIGKVDLFCYYVFNYTKRVDNGRTGKVLYFILFIFYDVSRFMYFCAWKEEGKGFLMAFLPGEQQAMWHQRGSRNWEQEICGFLDSGKCIASEVN